MSAAVSRLIFTRHAEIMLAERGIERAWVERAVSDPDATELDHTRDDVYRAYRSIPERDGRIIRVVYSKSGEQVRIITAFFDRSRRR